MPDEINKISEVVESLAVKVVMASNDDASSLEDLLAGFNKVASLAQTSKLSRIAEVARAAAGLTAGVMLGLGQEGITTESIALAVSCLQEMLRVVGSDAALAQVKIPDILISLFEPASQIPTPGPVPSTEMKTEVGDEDKKGKTKKGPTKVRAKSSEKKEEVLKPPVQSQIQSGKTNQSNTYPTTQDDIKAVADGDPSLLVEFIPEAFDHLDAAEKSLLNLEKNPGNEEDINSIFRAFHTIKGVAGFLNLQRILRLAHQAETLLDKCRKHEVELSRGRVDLVFDSIDALKELIGDIQKLKNSETIQEFPGYAELLGRLFESATAANDNELIVTSDTRLGEILVDNGITTKEAVSEALQAQESSESNLPLGEILIDKGCAEPKDIARALRGQADARKPEQAEDETVKIKTNRLDDLINMMGELVIAQAMVSQDSTILGLNEPRVERNMTHLGKITRDLQELSMAMRMVQIHGTFQKMSRLVRDLAKKSGKQIELVMKGEETELDRNLVEVINDPLVHMIRNAADHGIESAEQRVQSGKPETGTITLNAFHQGGKIVIEIGDDGRGLDTEAIVNKAIEKGIVRINQELTEDEKFDLIFHPGLSTAEKVTDVSGRGVGMDVVKKNLERLRGRVNISSTKGLGSTFQIAIPLTLAIIEGMVVQVGKEKLIIPMFSITESIQPAHEDCFTVQGRGEMLRVRDKLMPLMRFHSIFDYSGAQTDPTKAIIIVVSEAGEERGLMVDSIIGQQQVVIKNLGGHMQETQGVAGGTILGDGRVALIVDVLSLIALSDDIPMGTPLREMVRA